MKRSFVAGFARRVEEAGWSALAFAFGALFFGWVYDAAPLLLAGVLLVALFAWDAGTGARVLRRTRLAHRAPSRVRVDVPFQVELELRNEHPWLPIAGVVVRDGLEGQAAAVGWAVFPWVAAGEVRRVRHRMVARRRGQHRFEPSLVSTGFPLGFVRNEVERAAPLEILVHPRRGRVSEDLFARVAALDPSRRARRASRSEEEFRGLRDWRQGDNPRWIHWRSSARFDDLMVKEYEEPRSARLALAIETCARRPQERAALEDAISFAASLARACARRGIELSLLFADPEPRVFEIAGGRAGMEALLDALARLPSTSERSLPKVLAACPLRALRARLTICCAATADLLPREQDTARVRAAGGASWPLAVEDPEFGRLFRRADAFERFLLERRPAAGESA